MNKDKKVWDPKKKKYVTEKKPKVKWIHKNVYHNDNGVIVKHKGENQPYRKWDHD